MFRFPMWFVVSFAIVMVVAWGFICLAGGYYLGPAFIPIAGIFGFLIGYFGSLFVLR